MVESVRLVVLIAFCSQGDNVLDATDLVSYLDEWLKLKPQSGKVYMLYVTTFTGQKGGAQVWRDVQDCQQRLSSAFDLFLIFVL